MMYLLQIQVCDECRRFRAKSYYQVCRLAGRWLLTFHILNSLAKTDVSTGTRNSKRIRRALTTHDWPTYLDEICAILRSCGYTAAFTVTRIERLYR